MHRQGNNWAGGRRIFAILESVPHKDAAPSTLGPRLGGVMTELEALRNLAIVTVFGYTTIWGLMMLIRR